MNREEIYSNLCIDDPRNPLLDDIVKVVYEGEFHPGGYSCYIGHIPLDKFLFIEWLLQNSMENIAEYRELYKVYEENKRKDELIQL